MKKLKPIKPVKYIVWKSVYKSVYDSIRDSVYNSKGN